MAEFSGQDFVNYLKQFVGVNYVWGGMSPSGFDCSGLVNYGLSHFGVKGMPRTTYDMIGQGKPVGIDGLKVGDLVYFDTNPAHDGPDHVAVYMGGGKILHAPKPGDRVKISDMTKYYQDTFVGGRRVQGMIDDGGRVSSDIDTQKALSPAALAEDYGYSYSFLKHNPSLSALFAETVKNGWDKATFQAKLRDTEWWKQNSQTARDAEMMKYNDPATYSASVDAAKVQIQKLASEIGAPVSDKLLGKIASDSIKYGLDEGGLRNILGKYVTFTKGTLTGQAGMFEHTIRQYADQMGVSLNDQSIKNQAQLIARGMSTPDDFKAWVQEQAISSYPAYAEQIQGGQTMKDIASPYIQLASSELGVNPSAMTLDNPLIKSALNGLDANGEPGGLDLTDFMDRVRKDSSWRQSKNAQDQVMGIGSQVLKMMGVVQ